MSKKQRATWVLVFLLFLIVPQLSAAIRQFTVGYRPGKVDPQRVPFSWDMFSNRVERCTVHWSEEMVWNSHPIISLHEMELPLEWDIIFDHVDDYATAAKYLCQTLSSYWLHANLHCYLPDGTEKDDDFSCY